MPAQNKTRWIVEPQALINNSDGSQTAQYALQPHERDFNLGLLWQDAPSRQTSTRETGSVIQVRRYQTGFGQERGGLAVDFINNHPTQSIPIVYFESIPWILQLFLHTLRLERDGLPISLDDTSVVKDIYYQPAVERQRPSVLELSLSLPPKSRTSLWLSFEKSLLKYTEYPPDANRGFDIGYGIFLFFF